MSLQEELLVEIYSKYEKIILHETSLLSKNGLFLDLTQLPEKYKEAFIKWVIFINKDRIEKNQNIFIDMQLALKCPIWKLIKPPLSSMKLTKEILNKTIPLRKTLNTKPSVRSINTK